MILGKPGTGPAVQHRDTVCSPLFLQPPLQEVLKEVMVAVPLPLVIQTNKKGIVFLQPSHEILTGRATTFRFGDCLGRALELNKYLCAHRDWRNRLVIFEDVKITAMIETEVSGKKIPLPHIFYAIDKMTFRQVHEELRAAQVAPRESDEGRFLHLASYLPGIFRRAIFNLFIKFPNS